MEIIEGYSFYSHTRKPISKGRFHNGMYAVTIIADKEDLKSCAHVKDVLLADVPENMFERVSKLNHPASITCYSKFPFSCVCHKGGTIFKNSDEIANIENGEIISIAYDLGKNDYGNFGIARQLLFEEFKEYEQTDYFA